MRVEMTTEGLVNMLAWLATVDYTAIAKEVDMDCDQVQDFLEKMYKKYRQRYARSVNVGIELAEEQTYILLAAANLVKREMVIRYEHDREFDKSELDSVEQLINDLEGV